MGFSDYLKEKYNMDLFDWELLPKEEHNALVAEYKSIYGEFKLF